MSGLVLKLGPRERIMINGVVMENGDRRARLNIVTPDVLQKVLHLSGGNQQKVVLARWLLADPDVLIIDEPTHGIDVGAKADIYQILRGLVAEGKGILLISSELPELLALADRFIVIKQGKIAGEISGDEASEEKVINRQRHL